MTKNSTRGKLFIGHGNLAPPLMLPQTLGLALSEWELWKDRHSQLPIEDTDYDVQSSDGESKGSSTVDYVLRD